MSGHNRWEDLVAKSYPEVINARFPRGTKERVRAIAERSMMELSAKSAEELEHVPMLLSPSVIVRRAVLEYLDREETK